MKKTAKTLIVIAILIALIGISTGAYFITVNAMSKKFNLVKISTEGVPERNEDSLFDGFVQLSEVNLHYVAIGEGYPIILVHGNAGSYKNLEDLGRYLATGYKVYMVDSRCHGQSTVTDKISYDLMASDLKEFIDALGIEKPVVIGHSDGGINALVAAINYPDSLKGIVCFGANTNPKELKFYARLWTRIDNLFKKSILNDLMLNEPNITKEQLQSIKIPAYILAGEYDMINLKDTVFMANNIRYSRSAIIKGEGHSSYVYNGKKSYNLVNDFLKDILR